MRKLLLIIALTLLWSFSASAQIQTETKATKIKVVDQLPEPTNPNCRTHYTAPEAYESTAEGNVNTFSATYSTVTPRTCKDRPVEDRPVEDRPVELPCCTKNGPRPCMGCDR